MPLRNSPPKLARREGRQREPTLELGPIESENTLVVTREVVNGLGTIVIEMNGIEFSTGVTSLLGHPERIEQGILEFFLAGPLRMFQRLPLL